jgi:hypothetical protein
MCVVVLVGYYAVRAAKFIGGKVIFVWDVTSATMLPSKLVG